MSYILGDRIRKGLLGILVIGWMIGPAQAQSETGEKVYQRTLRGTVWVLARKGERTYSSGTGSLIDPRRRLIITNYHVVGEAKEVTVLFPIFHKGSLVAERTEYDAAFRSGRGVPGEVLFRDTKRDLALIEIRAVPPGAQPIRLARESASPGQRVHSVGNPGRSDAMWLYTFGTVRQVHHKSWTVAGEKPYQFDAKVVVTQSPTNQGDSGGPLVNDQGELVAVTQGMATNVQLVSLFIDVSEVKAFLASKKIVLHVGPGMARPITEVTSTENESKPGTESPGGKNSEDAEHLASTRLQFAKTLAAEGKIEKAKDRYEKLIQDFPKSQAATEAKLLLDRMNK